MRHIEKTPNLQLRDGIQVLTAADIDELCILSPELRWAFTFQFVAFGNTTTGTLPYEKERALALAQIQIDQDVNAIRAAEIYEDRLANQQQLTT